jgi:hypothetical protein
MTQQPLKDKIVETAGLAADKAKEGAAAALSYGREAGHAIKEEVTDRAAETLETARDAALAKAEQTREALTSTGDRLVESLHQNADDSTGLQKRVLNGLADGVSSATDRLRHNSLSDVGTQIRRYAHDNPGVFAAAAAVAGFAVARFMMSSATHDANRHGGASRSANRSAGKDGPRS